MQMIQELKELLTNMEVMEQTLRRMIAEQERREAVAQGTRLPEAFEDLYPLSTTPGFFKSKRPVGVIFANGNRVETPTWKKVVKVLMADCNKERDRHDALMVLRNRVQGRDRTLLSSSMRNMRSPIMIDDGLYLETHYDTESLLRITTERILKAVGYDYSGIKVAIRR